MAEKLEPVNEHKWGTFVDPRVKFKHSPDTKALIEKVMPYFPKSCTCISGYLDDADQFWKVSYHWEYLVQMLTKALSLKLSPQSLAQVQILKNTLLENPPSPDKGYVASQALGEPHDRSTPHLIIKRWEEVMVCKKEFEQILNFEEIPKKHPPPKPWHIAVAQINKPATSKHGAGYALDIQGVGMNQKIVQIAKALGATYTLDEKSHVHVEFKQGVLVGQPLAADDLADGKFSGWRHTGSLQ